MFQVNGMKTTITGRYASGMRIGNKVMTENRDTVVNDLVSQLQMENQVNYAPLLSSINHAIFILEGRSTAKGLNANSARRSYQAYSLFEKQVIALLGQEAQPIPTSLLTVVQDKNGGTQFIAKKNMQQAVSASGASHIYSGLRENGAKLKRGFSRLRASALLAEHYQDFYNQVINHSHYKKYRNHKNSNAQIAGFVAEAFVSHVALNHSNLLTNSISPELLPEKLNKDFDLNEIEVIVGKSTNQDRWTTGGDVILVDRYGEVLLNIQVKSTIDKASVVGSLSRSSLIKDLKVLKNLVVIASQGGEIRSMVEKIYDMFKVDVLVENTDTQTEQILEKTLKETLIRH